jgi:POT family proton-dependent oligopeptide transporter
MALGQYAAGMIAAATGGEGGAASRDGVLAVYGQIGWWSIGIGIVVMAIAPLVKRLMHDDQFGGEEGAQAEAQRDSFAIVDGKGEGQK